MPKFHVVRIEGKGQQVICEDNFNGEPLVFPNADDANWYAQDMTGLTGIKHQPRPIKSDEDWRKRERERFESGSYIKVPWHDEDWVKLAVKCESHFTHVARNNQSNVAFIADTNKGEADVHTAMKPSKYLATFYGHLLTEDVIRQLVADYKKLYDKDNLLKFAYTPEEIERVYLGGPHSCMSAEYTNYRSGKIHPVRVYSGPDLAIAYAEKGKRILARAVCWPEKKIYGRVYGDDYLLPNLLDEEGFRRAELEGARLTKLKVKNRYICPYIDSVRQVDVGEDYLIIKKTGLLFAGNTDGFCGRGFHCGHCRQEYTVEETSSRNINGVSWCESCAVKEIEEGRLFLCQYSNNYYNIKDAMVLATGETWHRAYVGDRGFQCIECRKYYPRRGRNNNNMFRRPPDLIRTRREISGYYIFEGICLNCPVQSELPI